MMREFQEEIQRLKAELARKGGGGGGGMNMTQGPGGTIVKKEVVEKIVEKDVVVEKIVEKKVHTGVTDEDIDKMKQRLEMDKDRIAKEQETERMRILTETNMSEQDMQRKMRELESKNKKLEAERSNQLDLIGKLRNMEEKMLRGNEMMAKALEQETHLHKAQVELDERKREELRIQNILEEQEEEQKGLNERYMSQDDQAQKLTVKLEKLFTKFKRSKQELNDVQVEFQTEKEDILEAVRDLTREIRLSKLILDNFVPPDEAKFLEDCATWDDETQEWSFTMPTRRSKDEFGPVRPASSTGCPRPTTDFSRVHRAMGDANPRFRYDQILQTDLDLPERFTEDIAGGGELSEALKSAVFMAVGDESPKSKSKNTAKGSFATASFPIARGLVSG